VGTEVLRYVTGAFMSQARTTTLEIYRRMRTHADAFVRRRLIAVALLIGCGSLLSALLPYVLKLIVDSLSGDAASTNRLAVLLVVYVLFQWLVRAIAEVRGYVYSGAEQRIQRALSRGLFLHVLRLPMRFHLERNTGSMTQTIDNGMQGLQIMMQQFVFAVLPVVVELGAALTVLASLRQPALLALFAGATVIYALAFRLAINGMDAPAREVSAAHADAHGVITDSLLNCEAIKVFGAEDRISARFDDALGRTERHWLQFFKFKATSGMVIATVFAVTLTAVLSYTLHGVRSGSLTVGDFVMISAYLLQVVRPIEAFGFALQQLSQGRAFLEKALDLLRLPPEEGSRLPSRRIAGPGALEFRNVSLSYADGQCVLRDVSFNVAPGTTVGIVGTSGAGKSSLVRLLTRLVEPDGGQILLDGQCLSSLDVHELRRAIAIVPQDACLFNDSLGYNIAFGRPEASAADVEQAARVAALHTFITTLPMGYHTIVGERGVKLSGGERQRVSIARVALLCPRVYVFDEATSSLDSQTERDILASVRSLSRDTTTLIIAHRLSAVTHAEEILVLDHGQVAERGSHEQLLGLAGRYAELWRAQNHPRKTAPHR